MLLPAGLPAPLVLAVSVLALLLAALALSRLVYRRLRRRAEELERRLAEKTVELGQTVEALRLAKLQLEERNRQLAASNARLLSLSLSDPLTGLANRRHFEERLAEEWVRATRASMPVAMILFDLDLFKRLNDTCGHQYGDECLRRLADFVDSSIRRGGDMAARFGGEEFAVVLPSTPLDGALRVAEALREGIVALALPHSASPFGRVTASFGVASVVPAPDSSSDALVGAADAAMYEAKAAGRNRVCSAPVGEASGRRAWSRRTSSPPRGADVAAGSAPRPRAAARSGPRRRPRRGAPAVAAQNLIDRQVRPPSILRASLVSSSTTGRPVAARVRRVAGKPAGTRRWPFTYSVLAA